MQPRIVPPQAAEPLDEPEIPIVLRLRRPMRRVRMHRVPPGIGPRFPPSAPARTPRPSRSNCRAPTPTGCRIATSPSPAGSRIRKNQRCHAATFGTSPRARRSAATRSRRPLDQAPQRKARDRRLGDPRGRHRPPGGPHRRPGKISFVINMEDDVRHHPVRPLVGKQRLDLGKGAPLVEMPLTQRRQAASPSSTGTDRGRLSARCSCPDRSRAGSRWQPREVPQSQSPRPKDTVQRQRRAPHHRTGAGPWLPRSTSRGRNSRVSVGAAGAAITRASMPAISTALR